MSILLGPDGRPMNFKKADPPKTGPSFGRWGADTDNWAASLPGGAIMGFDTSKLQLEDFRAMRDHPQINASLSVLTFMMHGLDWRIECEDSRIREMIESNMREVWTRLIRALSQSFWAGYSPIAIEYDNDAQKKQIVISKFKDLLPEECEVNWKKVDGYAPPGRIPPKFNVFDGMKQRGQPDHIPPENTLWYPILMENGNHYGRKLLKPAFAPWYFSILMHLFSNRYFERFGEPLPVGRAPFEDEIDVGGGQTVSGREAMETILMNLRNRGVVVLPNEKDPNANEYDYDIKYLESQMRGVDFERYLTRLDEEISLAIFTPVLLLRTSDNGSYNLGIGHMQMYMWMLNALAGDMKEYIDKYVIRRLKDFNFGPNAPKAEWVFRPMGKENVETVRAIVSGLISSGGAKVDFEQLSAVLGMTITEVKQVVDNAAVDEDEEDEDTDAIGDDKKDKREARIRDDKKSKGPRKVGEPRATSKSISSRVRTQVHKAFRENTFGKTYVPDLGYRKQFELALQAEGFTQPESVEKATAFYGRVTQWVKEAADLGQDGFAGPDDFCAMFDRLVDSELERLA